MINELPHSPTRSQIVYFASNKQVFTAVFCSLDAVKKASKKKKTRIKMEIVELLQEVSYRRKRSG